MPAEWLSGSYKVIFKNAVYAACIVDGHKVTRYGKSFQGEKGTLFWEKGDFGKAHKTVEELSGQTNYNIKLSSPNLKEEGVEAMFGIIGKDGKKVTVWFMSAALQYIWITEEEANEMRSTSEPVECGFSIQSL